MQEHLDPQDLLVFSDDWGRHPSSCQHLIHQLLPRHKVSWVNTIAMRPPRLDALTVKRGAEKAWQWCTGNRNTPKEKWPTGLSVYNPIMWPWMHSKRTRLLNRRLLTQQLRTAAKDTTVITTLPITADLVGRLSASRWIYYCVDDFSVWPGLSGKVLREMEFELIEKCSCVIAVSEHLADAIRPRHPSVQILTHGVDLDFWECEGAQPAASEATALFWGVVDRRMNADWLIALANNLTREKIILAGPLQDPDPRILHHPNINAIGPVAMAELPRMAANANVLIMPYADLPVTRAMQPLKFKEYLATGRPVVTSSLPAIRGWGDFAEIVDSEAQFVRSTVEYLRTFDSEPGRSDELINQLHHETWAEKARRFEQIMAAS